MLMFYYLTSLSTFVIMNHSCTASLVHEIWHQEKDSKIPLLKKAIKQATRYKESSRNRLEVFSAYVLALIHLQSSFSFKIISSHSFLPVYDQAGQSINMG